MGAHLNALQRAVVLGVAVVSAGCDSAGNTLVGMAVHSHFPLFTDFGISLAQNMRSMRCIF